MKPTLAEIERQLEELCNDVKELSAHQQMAAEAKTAKPTPWSIPEFEDEEDLGCFINESQRLAFTADEINVPVLFHRLGDYQPDAHEFIFDALETVYQFWIQRSGDVDRRIISIAKWDKYKNGLLSSDQIFTLANKVFAEIGVVENLDRQQVVFTPLTKMKKQSKKSIPAWREHLLQANVQIGELRRELAELKKQVGSPAVKLNQPPRMNLGGLEFPTHDVPADDKVCDALDTIFRALLQDNCVYLSWNNEQAAGLYRWIKNLAGLHYQVYTCKVSVDPLLNSCVLVLFDESRNKEKEVSELSQVFLDQLELPDPILHPPKDDDDEEDDNDEEDDAEELPVKHSKAKSNLFEG